MVEQELLFILAHQIRPNDRKIMDEITRGLFYPALKR